MLGDIGQMQKDGSRVIPPMRSLRSHIQRQEGDGGAEGGEGRRF